MAPPTVADVRAASNVDFALLGYADDVKLQRLLDVALRTTYRYTGQQWTAGVFSPVIPLSVDDEPLLFNAVLVFVEWMAYRQQADIVETMADFDLISSFSAGSYSETRRGGKDAVDAQRAFLKGLFWPLMSPDLQDEWLAQEMGVNPPSFAVTEVDWSGRGLGAEGPAGSQLAYPYPVYENWNPYFDPRFD